MTIPVRIVVRTKADWSRMDPERFAAQRDPTLPRFHIRGSAQRGVFDIWDRAFKVSFFEYRARLQEIASDSQRGVSNAMLTVGLDDIDRWLRSSDEEIVVPTDDDDFFNPGLADIAKAFEPNTNVLIWPYVTMGFTLAKPRRRFERNLLGLLFSNNWAIRKSYLARSFSPKTLRLMLAHHTEANEAIATDLKLPDDAPKIMGCRLLEHRSVRIIPEVFSLYNSHVGSIFLLLEILMSEDPVGFLRSLEHTTPIALPPYARPFEPYVRRLEALTSTLVRAPC